jgi:hypothetical protein
MNIAWWHRFSAPTGQYTTLPDATRRDAEHEKLCPGSGNALDSSDMCRGRQILSRQHCGLVNTAGRKISMPSAYVLHRSCTHASCGAG